MLCSIHVLPASPNCETEISPRAGIKGEAAIMLKIKIKQGLNSNLLACDEGYGTCTRTRAGTRSDYGTIL
jgi:hypothetical protein